MIDQTMRGPFYGLDLDAVRAMIERDGARAVAKRALESIERTHGTLNAFVHLDREQVLSEASRLDALPTADRGPLHGIPVAVKDLIDVAGWPVTRGSRLHTARIAERDAEVVTRLRAAGALLVGMTLTHEFAYGPTGDISKDGAARNPHDPARMSGGSSAGSGVAVAAGLVPLALGTDTGGSIRVPAALCGCVGLKPAHGEAPVDGVHDLAPTLDHVGVLASDAEIAWLGWSVLLDRPVPPPVEPSWSWLTIDRVPLVDEAVAKAVRGLFDLVSEGSTQEISLGNWPEMRGLAGTIMSREAYDVHAHHLDERKDEFDESTWERIDGGRHIGEDQYREALRTREQWRDSLAGFLDDDQILVSPTVGITAPLVGERDMTVGSEPGVSTRIVTNLTVRWNLVGFPAMSIPAGEIGGLPYGVQLVCKPGSEGALRRAAELVERVVGPGSSRTGSSAAGA